VTPDELAQGGLQNAVRCAILRASTEKEQMSFFVAQFQPHTEEVEVLYTCATEQQAIDECERTNAHLAEAGIPGDYYLFVL
jgi:hypothetical protein